MKNPYPWYDSVWLNDYVASKKFVADKHPHRLGEFETAFTGLRTRADFKTIKQQNFLDADALADCKRQIQALSEGDMKKREFFRFGRLIKHNLPFFAEMQLNLTPTVSALVGEEVEPRYNFLSLYNNFGICELHMDAPDAKWTLDICIDQSSEWPIHISNVVNWPEQPFDQGKPWADMILNNPQVTFDEFTQQPGDALLFAGSSQWHYRSRIPARTKQNFAHLVFFHYIPKGLKPLTEPRLWAKLFGIPELANVVRPQSGLLR